MRVASDGFSLIPDGIFPPYQDVVGVSHITARCRLFWKNDYARFGVLLLFMNTAPIIHWDYGYHCPHRRGALRHEISYIPVF